MMRDRLSRLGALVLIGSFVACGQGPDQVTPEAGTELVSLSRARVTNGTATFSFDQTYYWDCVNEMIHNVFQVSYRYTLVELPNGESVYRDLWARGTVGTITGLSSGTVWTRSMVSPSVQRTTGGGMEMFTAHVSFVSETGPTIEVHETFHLSSNANGEVTVDNYSFSCTLK